MNTGRPGDHLGIPSWPHRPRGCLVTSSLQFTNPSYMWILSAGVLGWEGTLKGHITSSWQGWARLSICKGVAPLVTAERGSGDPGRVSPQPRGDPSDNEHPRNGWRQFAESASALKSDTVGPAPSLRG